MFFFEKKGATIGFLKFLCCKFFLCFFLFCLLKHYKIGVSAIFCVFVVEREERSPKNDNWNFWICFSSKNGRFVTHNCFSKTALLKPQFFIVFLGARQVLKKGKFWNPQNRNTKFWLITEKLLVFFLLFPSFCFFVFCFFGGFKGQVRWPKGPPHLALNPPYMFFIFVLGVFGFFLFVFCCFVFVFFRV